MADPQTVNIGLFVPNTGADVGSWGAVALNPDFVAIDGAIAGVQGISVSNVPITLTSPAAFVPTPSGGPTQSQNRVLRFTGVMTGNVRVTLPLPGSFLIDNQTTGNFVLSFQGVTATEVVAIAQGEIVEIYNDGANVRFVNLARVGAMEMWAGLIAMPAWVAACTKVPYLLCDGSVHNFTEAPYLGARLVGNFGGNGITTFGVPDLRGRVPLAYDGTGTRITVAGVGLNGQTLGAALDQQNVTLVANQIPSLTSINLAQSITVNPVAGGSGLVVPYSNASWFATTTPATGTTNIMQSGGSLSFTTTFKGDNSISVTYTNAAQQTVPNVQPSQVTGIWVIKA